MLIAAGLGPASAEGPPPPPPGTGTPTPASALQGLPKQPDDLIAYVSKALNEHDLGAIDRLVEWTGARPIRKRMTLYQIRYNFGRPIKSAVVEPFPTDGLKQARTELNLKPNLPVSEQLRIVYDEPPGDHGEVPASVFLLGKANGVYRIALLLGGPPPK